MAITNRKFIVSEGSSQDAIATYMQNIVDFFDTHGSYQRIASYYGISGSGFNAASGSNKVGNNCWVVWKFTGSTAESWNIWIGGTYDHSTYPQTSNPSGSHRYNCGNTPDESGIAVMFAWHESGNPWNGSQNNNGRDSFATSSMWKSGSVIIPNVNSPTGFCSASRDCGINIFSNAIPTQAYCFLNASETYIQLFTSSSSGYNLNGFVFSSFTPATASFDLPYIGWGGPNDTLYPSTEQIFTRNSEGLRAKGGLSLRKPTSNGVNYFSSSYGFMFSSIQNSLLTYGIARNNGNLSLATKEFYEIPLSIFLVDADANYVGYFPDSTISTMLGNGAFFNGDIFGHNGESYNRIAYRYNTKTWCFPWSSSFGEISASFASSSFHTSQSVFLSDFGYIPITQSNLRDVSGSARAETIIYRGFLGGTYYYGTTNPPFPGVSNVVIIKRY